MKENTNQFIIKRIYEPAAPSDELRVLVDRLWPRGINKNKAQIDWWFKEIAPTSNLRIWFNHDPEKLVEFRFQYYEELDKNSENIHRLLDALITNNVTLLYAAKDTECNHAFILKEFLDTKRAT